MSFKIDCRAAHRHLYCANPMCQRSRRTQAQARRRANQAAQTQSTESSRLQSGVKPGEADILAENPLFVGLISMLTGSNDLDEIKIVSRRLYERGRGLLGITPEKISKMAA